MLSLLCEGRQPRCGSWVASVHWEIFWVLSSSQRLFFLWEVPLPHTHSHHHHHHVSLNGCHGLGWLGHLCQLTCSDALLWEMDADFWGGIETGELCGGWGLEEWWKSVCSGRTKGKRRREVLLTPSSSAQLFSRSGCGPALGFYETPLILLLVSVHLS